MSTIKVDNLQTTGGAGLYPARAWVNFNGTGTVAIRDSGNVSSLTDSGTTQYTVNFSNSLTSVNYAALASNNGTSDSFTTGGARQFCMVRGRATSSVGVQSVDDSGGLSDSSYVATSVFL
jgi:uncharacterized protein (AIM24 family)